MWKTTFSGAKPFTSLFYFVKYGVKMIELDHPEMWH